MGIHGFNLSPNNSYKNLALPLFVWDEKPDKIKRNVIINNYEEGGLKLPHIESFCKALKMSWLHKLLDPMNMSPWRI